MICNFVYFTFHYDPKYYYFSAIFKDPDCPFDKISIDKYEVKNILYNPVIPKKSGKYISHIRENV